MSLSLAIGGKVEGGDGWLGKLGGPQSQLGEPLSQLRGPQSRVGSPRGGGRGTDGRMNERTDNLPILQDFVPYRGHCPATIEVTI